MQYFDTLLPVKPNRAVRGAGKRTEFDANNVRIV